MAVGKEDKDDREFLKFPILYPGYIKHLNDKGFRQVFGTDWGKTFWDTLINAQQSDNIISLLNDPEKKFYIQYREEMRGKELSGERLLKEWEYLCEKIASVQQKLNMRILKEVLRLSQEAGDSYHDYLRVLKDSQSNWLQHKENLSQAKEACKNNQSQVKRTKKEQHKSKCLQALNNSQLNTSCKI